MSLTLDGTTGISATGNITGNNVIASGTLTAGTFSPTSLSASGNITASFFIGNGSQLTGIDATQIQSGTSNVKVVSSGGNATVGIAGTANVAVFASTGVFVTGVASASGNTIGGNILTAGLITATGNITGGNILTAGLITATGNIQGGNIRTAGLISATGSITTAGDISITGNIVDGAALTIITSSNGNITMAPNGTGVVVVNTDIRNGQASGTGNIGASGAVFNTIFAKATSAQYADLAEMYQADKQLDAGQVVEFGGTKEIQQTATSHSTRVAGIVSSSPSYLMNSALQAEFKAPVALTGRVPCYVIGKISKGDRLVASDISGVATVLDMTKYEPGCILGKALEDYDSQDIGRIEVAVGRF